MKIYTAAETLSFSSKEELLEAFDRIASDAQDEHQLIIIEKDEKSSLEVGVGMGDQSMVLYVPEDEAEDMKITCNEFVDRAKTEDLVLKNINNESSTFTIANIILLEEAREIIEAYLSDEAFTTIADWYTY